MPECLLAATDLPPSRPRLYLQRSSMAARDRTGHAHRPTSGGIVASTSAVY